MTKQEKTKVTKEAKSIFRHIDYLIRNNNDGNLALTLSRIMVSELILNSEGDKIKFWQRVQDKLFQLYYCEKKIDNL